MRSPFSVEFHLNGHFMASHWFWTSVLKVACIDRNKGIITVLLRNKSMLLTVIGYKCHGRIMFLSKCVMCNSKKSKGANWKFEQR